MTIVKRFVAIVIASSILSTSIPTRANPAILAPAAFCAGTAGVGCVLVGVAVVGGAAYYVWQNQQQQRHYSPIEDPEEEARYLGGPHDTEPVIAKNRKDAFRECLKLAQGRRLKEVRRFQGNNWDCIFYTGG